jgi:hypothetical protein
MAALVIYAVSGTRGARILPQLFDCGAGGPAIESERRFAKKPEAWMARGFVK